MQEILDLRKALKVMQLPLVSVFSRLFVEYRIYHNNNKYYIMLKEVINDYSVCEI